MSLALTPTSFLGAWRYSETESALLAALRDRLDVVPVPRPARRKRQPPRHECGTKICLQKGIEFARCLLGPANIPTTQRYMHPDDRELADAQDLVE